MKLVNDTQLDADLTSVANAIRTKGGTSASLAFPAGFVSAIGAIPTGGNLQSKSKSYTPSESAQSETVQADAGYDGLQQVAVSVGAISPTYVGSGITRRSSSDLSASGGTVTAPAGYYESAASKSVASGSATPASAISSSGGASVSVSDGKIVLQKTVNNVPQVSAGYISSGSFGDTDVTLRADATNLEAGNIKKDVTIFGITGTYEGGGGASNVVTGEFTTSSTTGAAQTIDIPYTGSGYPNFIGIYPADGFATGSSLYNVTQQYAILQQAIFRTSPASAPTYTGSGTNNTGYVAMMYKGTSGTNTTASRTNGAAVFTSSAAASAAGTCVRMSSAKKMSIFVAASSYGFRASTKYKYVIVYSA